MEEEISSEQTEQENVANWYKITTKNPERQLKKAIQQATGKKSNEIGLQEIAEAEDILIKKANRTWEIKKEINKKQEQKRQRLRKQIINIAKAAIEILKQSD